VGKTISEKNDRTIITKAEKWAKSYQKRGREQFSQKLKGRQNHFTKDGWNNYHKS
jgi:hypothetical protein